MWIPALLIASDGHSASFRLPDGEEVVQRVDAATLERVSEQSLQGGLSNLVSLDEFGEGAVVHQLRERYKVSTRTRTVALATCF